MLANSFGPATAIMCFEEDAVGFIEVKSHAAKGVIGSGGHCEFLQLDFEALRHNDALRLWSLNYHHNATS